MEAASTPHSRKRAEAETFQYQRPMKDGRKRTEGACKSRGQASAPWGSLSPARGRFSMARGSLSEKRGRFPALRGDFSALKGRLFPAWGRFSVARGELFAPWGRSHAARGRPHAAEVSPRATRGRPHAAEISPRATRDSPRAARGKPFSSVEAIFRPFSGWRGIWSAAARAFREILPAPTPVIPRASNVSVIVFAEAGRRRNR